MPVELSIVESVTELETTVVEVVLDSSSAPGLPGVGVPAGGTTGQLLAKDTNTDYDTEWVDAGAPGAHATTHQDGGADEISLTGLSGTPAALTTHEADTTNVHGLADTSVLATDSEVSTAVSDHSADTTSVHGIADTSVLATDSEVATAVSDHSADTTSVHGIADTSALALTANHPSNATFNDHSARHENGGADEVSVEGLSGLLADGQTPLSHNHAGEDITSGTVADARIAATIARDSEVATAVSDHSADTTSVHGIADTSVLATDSEVATAVSDHSADTTSVHGIADTSALALTANHPTTATFLDHSARHEDGGDDEISIAGLAGIPTELQTHLDDAADAHDASAVSIADAGSLYTATEVEALLQEIGTWQDYTPALTASSSNPNLGTSPTQLGRYVKIGKTVIGYARIAFGTGGSVAAGSGDYRVSLPVAPRNAGLVACGASYLRDSSTANKYGRTANLDGANQWLIFRADVDGTTGNVRHDSPFAWAASDSIEVQFSYEAA